MPRRFYRHQLPADPLPWVSYVVGVGSALGCLICATSLYLPKQEHRPFADIDRTVMRVQTDTTERARLTGVQYRVGYPSSAAQTQSSARTFATSNAGSDRR